MRKITPLKIGLLYALVFIALFMFAASMTMPTIPKLGGGSGTVTAPNVQHFSWQLTGSPTVVNGVALTFDANLTTGTMLIVNLLDASNVSLAAGNYTLLAQLDTGVSQTVSTAPSVDPSLVDNVQVVIAGPTA
jgi:hypothetical protein